MKLNRKNFQLDKFLIAFALLGDVIFMILCDLSAFSLRYETDITSPPQTNFLDYLNIVFMILVIRLIALYIFGLYYNLKSKTTFETTIAVVKATTISFLCIVAVAFYFRAFAYPRTVIIISWILITFMAIFWRLFIRMLISMIFGKNFLASRITIVGIDKEAQQFGLHISKNCAIQCEVVGFVNPESMASPQPDPPLTILGSLDELPRIAEEHSIDEVIIATLDIPREKLVRVLSELSDKGISCKVMPQIYEAVIGNIITTHVDDMATILISPLQEKFYAYRGFKRIVDLVASVVLLFFALPLMPLIILLIKATSAGPVLIKQKRVGLYGRHFVLYKFRTMYMDAEKSGPVWAGKDDPRITKAGRFLRKTRLDELPQLFNVFKNEMSLVGPRPERPYFVAKLKNEIPFYLERLTVKPGITGWAQITCPYADSIEDSREKFIHDIFYIKNMSLALDVLILFRTILTIIQEKGAQ